MAGGYIAVKRFRVDEGIVDTELRFLRKGDIFWYEKHGKPARLPSAAETYQSGKVEGYYLVAIAGPIWKRERNGKRQFIGVKYRAATDIELRLLAYSQTKY